METPALVPATGREVLQRSSPFNSTRIYFPIERCAVRVLPSLPISSGGGPQTVAAWQFTFGRGSSRSSMEQATPGLQTRTHRRRIEWSWK